MVWCLKTSEKDPGYRLKGSKHAEWEKGPNGEDGGSQRKTRSRRARLILTVTGHQKEPEPGTNTPGPSFNKRTLLNRLPLETGPGIMEADRNYESTLP